ncbi:MAG TPA: hypothetical protein VML96_13255, partial [Egibacteraceae bacterium]|nr:hypothetical protein [Egibacteraceae bacterium]
MEAKLRTTGELPPSRFVVGLDLGQAQDFSAVAVVERAAALKLPLEVAPNKRLAWRWSFDVRHLERLPLGTSYVDQVRHVRQLLLTAPLRGARLVLDQTGVGRPVADLFRAAGLRPELVTITGGSEASEPTPGEHRVPKVELISRLQALLHEGRFRVAEQLPQARLLLDELKNFEISYTAHGAMTFSARSGRHDDLVLAAAIAVWYAADQR